MGCGRRQFRLVQWLAVYLMVRTNVNAKHCRIRPAVATLRWPFYTQGLDNDPFLHTFITSPNNRDGLLLLCTCWGYCLHFAYHSALEDTETKSR